MMRSLPGIDFNPTVLLEWLRRGFWWLVFGSLVMFLPTHVPVIAQPDRWVTSGFRDLLVMFGWLVMCRGAAIRWPRQAVIVCLLGLLPISALFLTASTEVIRALDANPTTRMLLGSSILFALGLFGRWMGLLAGTIIAVLTLGNGSNMVQLSAGINVLFSIGMFGSLTRYVLDQLVQAHLKLERSALMDALTGLGNRRALDADHAAFRGGWLTLWDVDDLKRVNDTLGHAAGDRYLLEFTTALTSNLSWQDRAYRTGGDEFLTLTRNTPEALITLTRQKFAHVSAGWARLDDDLDVTMLEADTNLYDDKRERKATPSPDAGQMESSGST
jgi:GGDEF domain-containing protein